MHCKNEFFFPCSDIHLAPVMHKNRCAHILLVMGISYPEVQLALQNVIVSVQVLHQSMIPY